MLKSCVISTITNICVGTKITFGEFSASSALTWTHRPRIPFMAFSPGIGLSLGHGDAVYVGLIMSIFTGPTAFATPPMLSLLEWAVVMAGGTVIARREAVVLPRVNAILFDKNPLRDDDDDDDDNAVEMMDDTDVSELMCMCTCNLVAGT